MIAVEMPEWLRLCWYILGIAWVAVLVGWVIVGGLWIRHWRRGGGP
jgi:hypothetical protein